VTGDVLAIVLAFPVAHWLRFSSPLTGLVPASKGVPPLAPYLVSGAILTIVLVPLLAEVGHYRIEHLGSRIQKVFRIVRAATLGVLAGAALTFFYREFTFSRSYVPVLYVVLLALLLLARAGAGMVSRRWQGRRPLHVLLVGASPSGQFLADRMLRHDVTGLRLEGRLAGPTETPEARAIERRAPSAAAVAVASDIVSRVPVLGGYEDVAAIVESRAIDVVVLALPSAEAHAAERIVAEIRRYPADIELVPDVLQLLSRRARVRELDGVPILSLREIPLTGWGGVVKRTFDLVVSAGGLLLAAPVLALLALLVRSTSPGPVFYRQERLGRDGRRFEILKFRSMPVDAERDTGPVWATRTDARPTRVGAFLRRWSLDELPQLLNVLRGEMSLVGPRPERPHFVREFSRRMPDYLDRHRVKSGITGWAQVNGLRGDTSIEERTRYDLHYVENWSLAFDVEILLRTLIAVVRRREAY